MDHEFKKFSKIPHIDTFNVRITQKLHGTNAGIYRYQDENGIEQIKAASRTRFISIHDDNYGFARYVEENKEELIEFFDHGWHYGEWVGKGINNNEGITDSRWLALFSPPLRYNITHEGMAINYNQLRLTFVPELLDEKLSLRAIDDAVTTIMQKLKEDGSFFVSGFMKPEGIVVEIDGVRYKKTFEQECAPWKGKPERIIKELIDVTYLLQPIRLDKILSSDEKLMGSYPISLSTIASLYVNDLIEEKQIEGDDDKIKLIKKSLGKILFSFIKQHIKS